MMCRAREPLPLPLPLRHPQPSTHCPTVQHLAVEGGQPASLSCGCLPTPLPAHAAVIAMEGIAMGANQAAAGRSLLLALPDTVLAHIAALLQRCDRLTLRSTCKPLCELLSGAVGSIAIDGLDQVHFSRVFPACRVLVLAFFLRHTLGGAEKRRILRGLIAAGAVQRAAAVHVSSWSDTDEPLGGMAPPPRGAGPAQLDPALLLELAAALPRNAHLWLQVRWLSARRPAMWRRWLCADRTRDGMCGRLDRAGWGGVGGGGGGRRWGDGGAWGVRGVEAGR